MEFTAINLYHPHVDYCGALIWSESTVLIGKQSRVVMVVMLGFGMMVDNVDDVMMIPSLLSMLEVTVTAMVVKRVRTMTMVIVVMTTDMMMAVMANYDDDDDGSGTDR